MVYRHMDREIALDVCCARGERFVIAVVTRNAGRAWPSWRHLQVMAVLTRLGNLCSVPVSVAPPSPCVSRATMTPRDTCSDRTNPSEVVGCA